MFLRYWSRLLNCLAAVNIVVITGIYILDVLEIA